MGKTSVPNNTMMQMLCNRDFGAKAIIKAYIPRSSSLTAM